MAQRYVLLVVAATLASVVLALQPDNDIETIRERLAAAVLEESAHSDDPEQQTAVAQRLSSLTADRQWPDIDYASRNRSRWLAVGHLQRVRDMAIALRSPGASEAEKSRLLSAIEAALGYWLERDFQSPNWWWNEIGVPRLMSQILLLAGDALPPNQTAAMIRILTRSTLKGSGQNLVWQAENNLVRGLFQQDSALVREALGAVTRTITTTRKEGIKPDLSFHQHGPILYSGGYGLGFSVDTARLACATSGTRFALPDKQIELLARYILDGQQWMTYADVFDYTAVGREIARRNKNARILARACDFMARFPDGNGHGHQPYRWRGCRVDRTGYGFDGSFIRRLCWCYTIRACVRQNADDQRDYE